MSYIKLEDAKNAIMNCITEQTVSKYATSAECRAARHGADLALFAIDYVPTADAVEVVRCKDCEYWEERCSDHIIAVRLGNCEKPLGDYIYQDITTAENDYCSYGERKEK